MLGQHQGLEQMYNNDSHVFNEVRASKSVNIFRFDTFLLALF
jgi:hypothetical protein